MRLAHAVADRKQVGHDIRDFEFGWPVGTPLYRSLGAGLWEVRSNLPSQCAYSGEAGKCIARELFCLAEGELVLLHGFIKKTQKTPPHDLKLATQRMQEVTR